MIPTIDFCKRFGIQIEENPKQPPSMYWIPKMHKKLDEARFIIANKNAQPNLFRKIIPNIFNILFKHVENFHKKVFSFLALINFGSYKTHFQL